MVCWDFTKFIKNVDAMKIWYIIKRILTERYSVEPNNRKCFYADGFDGRQIKKGRPMQVNLFLV